MKVPLKNSHCRQGDKGHREEASREGPVDWQLAAHPSSQSKRPLLLHTCPFLAPNSQRDELGQHPVPNMNTHTHRRPGNDKVNKCCKGKQDVNASNIYFKFNMALTVAASCTGPSFCFPFICSIGLFASAFAIVCPLSRSVLLCVLSLLCLITLLNKSPGQVGSLD